MLDMLLPCTRKDVMNQLIAQVNHVTSKHGASLGFRICTSVVLSWAYGYGLDVRALGDGGRGG